MITRHSFLPLPATFNFIITSHTVTYLPYFGFIIDQNSMADWLSHKTWKRKCHQVSAISGHRERQVDDAKNNLSNISHESWVICHIISHESWVKKHHEYPISMSRSNGLVLSVCSVSNQGVGWRALHNLPKFSTAAKLQRTDKAVKINITWPVQAWIDSENDKSSNQNLI